MSSAILNPPNSQAHSSLLSETHAVSELQEQIQAIPNNGILHLPANATEAERLALLGVDFSKYPSIAARQAFEPIMAPKNRELFWAIGKGMAAQAVGLTVSPTMLTHIVTTRCNYSCGFCSFADTLNAKTNELSLADIEKTYATIGKNLNTIVYSGGETTLNKDLADIIEAAYRLTSVKSVYIISNAWKPDLIFQITHKVMQRCPGLHLTWSLSIEGPKPINNATRHTKLPTWDAWQNTVDTAEGLKRMRQLFGYDELDVQLCTVCSPDNTHILNDWYEMVRDVLQPDKWNLNLMRRSVQMTDAQLTTFDERRKRRLLEPFEAKYLELTERVRRDVLSGQLKFLYHTKNPKDGALKSAVDLISQESNRRVILEDQLKPLLKSKKMGNQKRDTSFCCKAGSFGAFIGSEGEVSGCEEFAMNPVADQNKQFGNLRDVDFDFQKIWHSKKAKQHRKEVGKAPECRGCTLESQKNYPSILMSFRTLMDAIDLANDIH